MALTTVATVKAWGEPTLDSRNDDVLSDCIDAAEALIERVTGRVLNQASFTRYFSGGEAVGRGRDTIYLQQGHRPVIHSGGDLVTVTEDGSALTVAVGYSATANVILSGVNEDKQCALRRNYSVWSNAAYDNITVTYKAGWTTSTVPNDVKQLIAEVAWLIFRSPGWLGKASTSKAGTAVSFEKDLTPQSAAVISQLRGL